MKKGVLIVASIILLSCNSEYDKQLELGANAWCESKQINEEIELFSGEDLMEKMEMIEQRDRLLRQIELHKGLSGDEDQFEIDIKELSKDC